MHIASLQVLNLKARMLETYCIKCRGTSTLTIKILILSDEEGKYVLINTGEAELSKYLLAPSMSMNNCLCKPKRLHSNANFMSLFGH